MTTSGVVGYKIRPGQAATNLRQSRLRVLDISILPLKIPQNGIFAPNFVFLKEQFWQNENFLTVQHFVTAPPLYPSILCHDAIETANRKDYNEVKLE